MMIGTFARLLRLALLSALCLLSCSDPASIHVESVNFLEDGDGFRRFHAEVPGYYNRGFLHFAHESRQSPMLAVQSEVKKLSGFSDVGFGIVYCLQDDGDYYRLLIKTDATYCVTRKIGSVKETLIDWTPSDHLVEGYGSLNEIRVLYDEPGRRFTIFFNGAADTSYVDAHLSGGYTGFYAIIGPEDLEQFPDVPVDIRFRQILPTPDPR